MPSLTLFAASLKMYITHKSKIIISQTALLSSRTSDLPKLCYPLTRLPLGCFCLQCIIDYALYKLTSAKKVTFRQNVHPSLQNTYPLG